MHAHGRHRAHQDNHGGLIGGAIMVALGVAFLLRRTLNIDLFDLGWPLFIIGPGLFLGVATLLGGRSASYLAIPASVVTTIGAILLFQSAFDYFQSWAYVWALIPTAVGVGTIYAGLSEGKPKVVRSGVETASGGLVMFAAFGAFFELFIFHGAAIAAFILPVALIAVGLLLLLRGRLGRRREETPWYEEEQPAPQPQDEGRVFPY